MAVSPSTSFHNLPNPAALSTFENDHPHHPYQHTGLRTIFLSPSRGQTLVTAGTCLQQVRVSRRRQGKLHSNLVSSVLRTHSSETLTTNSSSRYLDTAIWSPSPLRLRVFSTRSLASACPDAGSSGRSLMLVSVGSPVPHHCQISPKSCPCRPYLELSTSDRTPAGKTPGPALPSSGRSQSRSRQ